MIIKSGNISTNYILNITRLLLSVLVLLFTMPYISRTLGSEGIGKVDYAYTIIEYFFLFSTIGIPVYGIRQIARWRDNSEERSLVMLELLAILTITTILAYAGLFVLLQITDFDTGFKNLLLFLSIAIGLSNFGVEWFYQGIEDQKFITIRYVFIKTISVILLFWLVKSPNDVYYYALFIMVTNFGGSIFNIIYLRKFIIFNKNILKKLNLKRHIKPALIIFTASVSTSIYILLDKIMLGSMVSNAAVGFYTQAVKLPRQAILIVTAIGGIMLPRLSNLLHNGNREQYIYYMQKSLKYILIISVPASLAFLLLAEDIILVMAGKEFIPAITTLKISAPNIFIVAMAYYVGFQVLYPLGKEKIYTIAVTAAAVVNIIFNYFTIQALQQDGAALGTLIAELTGLLIMIIASRKILSETGFFKIDNAKYLLAGAVMAVIIYLCLFINMPPLIQIIVTVTAGLAGYFLALLLMSDVIVKEMIAMGLSYIKRK